MGGVSTGKTSLVEGRGPLHPGMGAGLERGIWSKGTEPESGKFSNLEVFPSSQVGLVLREVAEEALAVAYHPPPPLFIIG